MIATSAATASSSKPAPTPFSPRNRPPSSASGSGSPRTYRDPRAPQHLRRACRPAGLAARGFSLLAPTHLGPLFRARFFLRPENCAWRSICTAARPGGDDESLIRRPSARPRDPRAGRATVRGRYLHCRPGRLSLAATMPRLLEMERTTAVSPWGRQQRARAAPGRQRRALEPVPELPQWHGDDARDTRDAAGHVDSQGRGVVAISRTGDAWRLVLVSGESIDADAVIGGARLCGVENRCGDCAGGCEVARRDHYASSATVNLTFREADFDGPPRAFGFVVPAIDVGE